jgi:helicase
MALRAVFIGINKHSDPGIPELTGATKDATALWALFRDSVAGITDQRLLDNDATTASIRSALDASLGDAAEDDTVLVFFAGHGTPGHRLVTFDTDLSAIGQTTIPMQELADRLKGTAARASLVILDCCFSGGAPARVLEGLPMARAGKMAVTDLGGEGRVVLAAARDDQEALELGQHGLFTAALLRVLREEPRWTDIGVLMAEVARQVRAEAARTGHEQSPVWAGIFDGGLELPPLHAGPIFAAEFPDTTGIRVGSAIAELAAFAVPQSVLDAWTARFSNLNNLQLSAVNDYRVLDGQSVLVVAPTTSGKTFVGELAAARAISEGRKGVFLLPFKALTNEKFEEFDELYGKGLGLRVLRCTGDYTDQTESFVKGQYDIALLTYEMFLGLSVAMPSLLFKIGLVVLDEAQFITDPRRGIVVELLLTNLLAAREHGVEPQIIALSAVIGAVNHFDEWLGCRFLATSERPVPLVEGVLDRNGTYQYVDVDGQARTEQLLQPREIVQRRQGPSSQDVIVPLVRKLVGQGEQVLIFRNKRGSTSGCANYLAQELGLPPATEVLGSLPDQDLSAASAALRQALTGGTAFHTSDLSREERVVVERAFRNGGGPIRVVAATSTVAAGVNTPVETVIIVETEFAGRTPEPYTVAVYKNMVGRAGRLGLAVRGRSILLAGDPLERARLFAHYVMGRPEPIRSSFDPKELDTWILRLLTQVKDVPRDAVVTLLANTYAGYLATRASAAWQSQMRAEVEELLDRMLELGLLEIEMAHTRLSLLGKACGKSHLKLRSAMRLVELLRRRTDNRPLTAGALLALVHALPEFDEAYTPLFRKGQRETVWQSHVVEHHGRDVAAALQWGAPDSMAYHARCKRVAVLRAWTAGMPISEIENTFTVSSFHPVGAGDIRGFAEFARFHLAAAFEIADVFLLGQGPSAEEVERLLAQLEGGIPVAALGLLDLPATLGRGSYLALNKAGIVRPEDVWAAGEERLHKVVGNEVAAALLAMRPAAASSTSVAAPSGGR